MTITLPVPTITTPHSFYRDEKGRSRKITYALSTETTDGGKTITRAIQVHVHHSKHRKGFVAVAHRVTIGTDPTSPFTTEAFKPFDGVTLLTEPVGRFSAKAIEAFTERVRTLFEAAFPTSPALQALAEPDEEWE